MTFNNILSKGNNKNVVAMLKMVWKLKTIIKNKKLLVAYNRIRRSVRNGLAVVSVKRDACGGCFNRIPPQRQVDVRQGKKLIVCEYCGRILVNDNEE